MHLYQTPQLLHSSISSCLVNTYLLVTGALFRWMKIVIYDYRSAAAWSKIKTLVNVDSICNFCFNNFREAKKSSFLQWWARVDRAKK